MEYHKKHRYELNDFNMLALSLMDVPMRLDFIKKRINDVEIENHLRMNT